MTYRGFLSRAEIGLRPPDSRSTNIDASRGGVTAHYAGAALGVSIAPSGHSKCLSLWRGFQNYHMDKHGWVDIAYTLGVCQHGYILAGRGANVRTGANGTTAGNAYWYAVCFILGGSEKPTQDTADAFWEAVRMLRRDGGAANRVNDHSKHKPTACAGDPVRALIAAGEPSMADHNHELTEMPDWGRSYWEKFVADGVTSVAKSWKWMVHRIDLAWLYGETIVPLQNKVKNLSDAVSDIRDDIRGINNKISSLASEFGSVSSKLSTLESRFDAHLADHVTGDPGNGEVPDHQHEGGTTGKVVR